MTNLATQPSWMIIVLEATAVLLIVSSALLLHLMRQSRRDHRIVRSFVDAVHLDLRARQQSLIDLLDQRFRVGGQAAAVAVEELVELEREVYRTLITAYHRRDGMSLLRVHTGLKKILWASFDLVPTPHEFGTDENQMRFLQLQRELAIAEERNADLQQRIRNNEQEMRTLLAEYQRIFSKQQDEASAAPKTG